MNLIWDNTEMTEAQRNKLRFEAAALSTVEQRYLAMRLFDGMSFPEMAELDKVTKQYVWQCVEDGMKKLKAVGLEPRPQTSQQRPSIATTENIEQCNIRHKF